MNTPIYLDYNATTSVAPEAADASGDLEQAPG